jgi:hypothetical protein
LRNFFLRPTTTTTTTTITKRRSRDGETRRFKPRQRLLALGSVFAVPSFDRDDDDDDDDDYEKAGEDAAIRDVRFYQVVDVQYANMENDGDDDDAMVFGERPTGAGYSKEGVACIISPSTRLVLVPQASTTDGEYSNDDAMILHPQLRGGVIPTMRGYALRLPRPSLAISFLRSVDEVLVDDGRADATTKPSRRHPSANDVVDSLYLQGAIPAHSSHFIARQRIVCHDGTHPRIIHVVGKEENNIRACVDEACDVSELFHVSYYFFTANSFFSADAFKNTNSVTVDYKHSGNALVSR